MEGKIYYVTPDMDMNRVNELPLQYGDIVKFHCGGIWRGQLHCRSGITYTSYGRDSFGNTMRPRFYNAIHASAPALWYRIGYGNLWVFDVPIASDVGILVCNCEASGKECVGIKKINNLQELQEERDFYHNPVDQRIYFYSQENPAILFPDGIEMGIRAPILWLSNQQNITIDNLCVKFGGAHGIAGCDCSNITIRNCEVGWIGGSIQEGTTRYGNAIEFWRSCEAILVENCYIYQTYDAGITHQYKGSVGDIFMKDVTYRYNLIELCTYSIEYFLDNTTNRMENIQIYGNICKYAGMGWGNQRPDKETPAHIKAWNHANPCENFEIHHNIFDRSKEMLLHIGAKDEFPLFRGNTYIQYQDAKFGKIQNRMFQFSSEIQEFLVKKWDEEAILLTL